MDRDQLSRIAHADHPIAAPVHEASVQQLLRRLTPPQGGRAVDLGCGWGAWLLQLLDDRPDLTGVGVDVALPPDLDARARARGVSERVSWTQANAASWHDGTYDVVICVGASHAFGGVRQTLEGVRRSLRPGGQVLLGDGFWERPASPAATEVLGVSGTDLPDLTGLLDAVAAHGFEPGYGHVSTLEEWDDYEWSWTGSLVGWALEADRDSADRDEALAAARDHRAGWLDGYRGELGFVTLMLHDVHDVRDPGGDHRGP